jgi:hypothetical protein
MPSRSTPGTGPTSKTRRADRRVTPRPSLPDSHAELLTRADDLSPGFLGDPQPVSIHPGSSLSSGCAFRVQRSSRSGCIAHTTWRTSREPASFRPLDRTMSRMSMRRKAQKIRLPCPLTQWSRRSSIRESTNRRCFLSMSYPRPIPPDTGGHDIHARPLDPLSGDELRSDRPKRRMDGELHRSRSFRRALVRERQGHPQILIHLSSSRSIR